MKRSICLGDTFGRYTVIGSVTAKRWLCKCGCGIEQEIHSSSLLAGLRKSCGCLSAESKVSFIDYTGRTVGHLKIIQQSLIKHQRSLAWDCICNNCGRELTLRTSLIQKHRCRCKNEVGRFENFTKHPLYHTWKLMIRRCSETTYKGYEKYGAKGISVCKRWYNFFLFAEDMGTRPDGCTIDRKDPYGDYTPANCRWATQTVQQNNRTNNIIIIYNEQSMSIKEWAKFLEIKYMTIYTRYRKGLPLKEVFRK